MLYINIAILVYRLPCSHAVKDDMDMSVIECDLALCVELDKTVKSLYCSVFGLLAISDKMFHFQSLEIGCTTSVVV